MFQDIKALCNWLAPTTPSAGRTVKMQVNEGATARAIAQSSGVSKYGLGILML